jgi:hypothetical protein
VLAAIRQANRDDFESRKETRRTDQLARVHRHLAIMSMETKKPWAAIQAMEKLASEIEGNLAPRRLDINVSTIPDALAQSCAGLTEELAEQIIAEELEAQRKLAAISTTGESLPEQAASPRP